LIWGAVQEAGRMWHLGVAEKLLPLIEARCGPI
jgi:hypothetical protein